MQHGELRACRCSGLSIEFLSSSMAHSTVNAFDIVQQLDRGGKLDDVPNNKKQKTATGLLRDRLWADLCTRF